MAYTLYTKTANKSNYGSKRSTSSIKYIVIHYTGNNGDKSVNNATYFKNNVVKASAHYFVDDTAVYQSVPDSYVAWSVGGSKYSDCPKTGGGKKYGLCKNANSISIELCDTVKDGKIYPSEKTIENAITLTKKLMKKYGIPASRVIRHFDVTGKSCPSYWCGTTAKNNKWKTEFWNKLSASTTTPSTSHIKIAHATNGPEPIKGGEAGDQTGKEVCIREWYSKPYTHVIRFKDASIREKIAKFFELTAKNDNVGYDQSQRNTFFKQLKKNDFVVSKINTKCETDCSALASSACVYADRTLEEVVYPNEKGSTTRNIRERLESTGKVDVLTADKYVSSDKYALRGDLYLAEGKHIVCALENGSKVEIEAGSTVKIVKGAVYGGASYGVKVSDFCIGEKYTITKIATHVQGGDNVKEALLKEISSWVPVKYLERA